MNRRIAGVLRKYAKICSGGEQSYDCLSLLAGLVLIEIDVTSFVVYTCFFKYCDEMCRPKLMHDMAS